MIKKESLIKSISLILTILIAICIATIFLYIAGLNPGKAWITIGYGSIGSKQSIAETLVVVSPILLAALGIQFAFKCGVWNIGAEGQLYMGAIGASVAAIYFPLSFSAPLHLAIVISVAFLFGGAWAIIPAILKVKLKINEILTTLMMNYIAIWIVHYLVYGPWRDLTEINPRTSTFPTSAWLPLLIPGTRMHMGLLIGLISAVFTYIVFKYRRLGYNINVVGANPKCAQYSGISWSKTIIITMFISGGLAGLAGMGEVCGIHHYLRDGVYPISPGYGYIAIGATLLGGLNAWGTVIASIVIGSLFNGVSHLTAIAGGEYLHADASKFIVGLLILAVLAKTIFFRKLMPERKKE